MEFTSVFFDFDGVLCREYFYTNLKTEYPDIHIFIQQTIFNGKSDIPNLWMKNILTYEKVNEYISLQTGIEKSLLNRLFWESVEEMQIEEGLIQTALKLKERGIKIALITDNMDVFNTITIKKHNLDKIFPLIINSCDYGYLKTEKNGLLFDIAMEKMGEKNISKTLMIDNSSNVYNIYTAKGGNCYKYKEYEEFSVWAKKNLNI